MERGVEVSSVVLAQPDPAAPVELMIELFSPIFPVSRRGAEPGLPVLEDEESRANWDVRCGSFFFFHFLFLKSESLRLAE